MKISASLLIVAILALLDTPTFAFINLGADETIGTHQYAGTDGYFAVGQENGIYLEPKFSTYHSEISNGTYSTYGGRLGYDQNVLSLGGEVNITPKINGYQKISTGGDITFTLTPESGPTHRLAGPNSDYSNPSGHEISRLDIGGGLTYVEHHEDLATGQFHLGETKYTAFAGAKVLFVTGNAQITKSLYNGNFLPGAYGDRALQLPGVMPEVQGFPDTTWNAKVGISSFLGVKPYASYTHTTFQLQQPTSNAYAVGGTLGLGLVTVKGAYTLYDPSGGQIKQHYVTAGATLN